MKQISDYKILTADNYHKGIQEIMSLGEQGILDPNYHQYKKQCWRPLSIEETIRAIIDAHKSGNDSPLKPDISTASAVAYMTYKVGDTTNEKYYTAYRIKLAPVSQDLLEHSKDLIDGGLKTHYSSLKAEEIYDGRYFEIEEDGKKAWLEALEGDENLLNRYMNLASASSLKFHVDDHSDFINNSIYPLTLRHLESDVAISALVRPTRKTNFLLVYAK
ncbi:MAG: hypothetical protein DRN71_02690 [Candidatus Nanohalarchaeota archaeon]|nr:MAG: hypothetical protein DRN71_02690 [Candidatus Nanohaloarchaeota archaeon]